MSFIVIDYQVEDVDETQVYPAEKRLQKWLDKTLEVLNVQESLEVTVRLVGNDEMTELNSDYRGKTKLTNVLAFPCDWDLPEKPRLLGDIVIAVDVVNKEAKIQKKAVSAHWAHIIIHGFLHLLGYDHIEESQAQTMENLETSILLKLGFDDPYGAEKD